MLFQRKGNEKSLRLILEMKLSDWKLLFSTLFFTLSLQIKNMTATSLQYQAIHPDLLIGTYTVAEYLEIERSSGERHEYYNGKIIRMAGGSVDHNRISRNVLTYLNLELDKKANFEVFGSDQKVYLPKLNLYLYPDVIVIAEAPIMAEQVSQAIVNPILVIEVLSPSTENYDRKDKFMLYRTLESFKEYVIIQQNSAEILTMFRNKPQIWEEQEFIGLENTVYFKSIDVHLPLSLIYKNVTL